MKINNLSDEVRKVKLSNGITALFEAIPSYRSVSVGFFLKLGSRNENLKEAGYSHFCEHMLFKETTSLKKNEISSLFDEMGGYINAYTTHENIVIYNRVPNFLHEKNINLMFDIFNDSIFDEKELELERNVIVNEIRSDFEDPHEKVHEDFLRNIFNNYSLGLPIIGNEESIKLVDRQSIYEFYLKNFLGNNLLISVCGDIDIDATTSILEQLKPRRNLIIQPSKAEPTKNKNRYFHTILQSEQVHLIMGAANFEITEENYFHYILLNSILGESMSSRFFQKIRDELGLCYSIYSFFSKFKFESLFGLYVSVMPHNLDKTITEISKIIKDLLKNGITEKELERAKQQKIGETILGYDVLQKRMQRIALYELKFGKQYSYNDIVTKFERATLKDVNKLVKKIFNKNYILTQTLYKESISVKEWEF